MDKFKALRVFRTLIDCGSFTATAQRMALSPASISKIIQDLEADLATALITRTTRSLALTEAGALYLDRITPLLEGLEEAEALVSDAQSQPRGTLRISAPVSLGLQLLNPRFQDFLKAYPDITLDIALDDRPVDLIRDGFDLALRGRQTLSDSSLIARKLFDIDRVICASPTYLESAPPLSQPEDLAQHQALIYTLSDDGAMWSFRQPGNAAARTVAVTGRYRANNSLALKQAALAGQGLALLPKVYVEDALASRQLIACLSAYPISCRSLYALYPAHKEKSLKLRTLINYLQNFTTE